MLMMKEIGHLKSGKTRHKGNDKATEYHEFFHREREKKNSNIVEFFAPLDIWFDAAIFPTAV